MQRSRARGDLALVVAALATAIALPGCSSPTSPPPPPGGGSLPNLSFDQFAASVAPVLQQHGCDAGGDCHGAGIRGSLQLSPQDAKDPQYDFDQVVLQVWAAHPDQSPILTEPLSLTAGGTPHAIKPFASTADSGYVAIRSWIQAGVAQ